MMFEDYNRLVLFDTETSGLSPENSEILEIGMVVLTKPKGKSKFEKRQDINVLIKNNKPILNSHIHHITDTMCQKRGISKEELFSLLHPLFGDYKDTLLVAYNLPFDIKFIKSFMNQIKEGYEVKNPTLDLLEVAKDRTGLYKGNKLCDMIVRYEVKDVQNNHRALDDTIAMLEVMRAMFKEKPNLDMYIKEERR